MTRQRIWVVALSLFALVLFMPAASNGWQPRGTFGMRILRAENLVRGVDANSPAEQAGITPGDRVDLRALGVDQHLVLMAPPIGATLHLTIDRGDAQRAVILTAVPSVTPPLLRWLNVGQFVSTAAFIVVGALLVYLRPAPMTWWLWAFCIGIVPVNQLLDFYSFLPLHAQAVVWLLARTFLGGFSAFPLMPFVLRFPYDRIGGWRAPIRRGSISLTVVLLIYYATISWIGLNHGIDEYSLLNGIPALLVYLFSAVLLVATYVRSIGAERQRLKWAVTGMLVGFVAQIFVYIPGPVWQSPLAGLVSVVMPLSVAYAALKHRLIDADFVINRALVYGGLTAILVSIVSLVDFVVSQFISEYHLALYLEAGASIAIGFALDRFRSQLDRTTDRLFFQSRHAAEAHLDRVSRSLEFVSHEESIYEALVDEPVQWLKLASAALFTFDAGRDRYIRVHGTGWTDASPVDIVDDAPVVRYLRTERTALSARDVAWQDAALPAGAAAPALYVPVFTRERLRGFVVYGGHVDTTTLDPGEAALLEAFGPRAGLAFDHLDFDVLEKRLAAFGVASETSAPATP